MKIAYFDCEFGAAGDMLVGTLLSAGASLDHIKAELAKLNLPSAAFELSEETVTRGNVACIKFNVLVGPEKSYEDGLYPGSSVVSQALSETKSETKLPATQPLSPRDLPGILTLFQESALSKGIVELASKIFTNLFKAKAECEGISVENLCMDELMAMDAIIDIGSFAIAYEFLAIEKSFVSHLPLGTGVFSRQGIMCLAAAPATVHILKENNAPISENRFENECLTPTGAAILCSIVGDWRRPAIKQILRTGYGAGSYNPATFPNAARVLIGEAADETSEEFKISSLSPSKFFFEDVVVVEANIDDLSPQLLAYASERLLEAGALDVLVLPALMKKGRSGHLLKVLCRVEDQQKLQEIMFAETSTIGVRFYTAHRVIANREWREVELEDGTTVRVKVALDKNGSIMHAQPEYEDCAAYARKHNIPLKNLVAQVLLEFDKNN